jgi:DNA-directed RNA polymerase specialized sigma24 family protein
LELHLEQELSFEEIAAAMDTTVGAVYARKNRIRKKLISMIEARDRA